jgi:CheY-like chemotaxis protein
MLPAVLEREHRTVIACPIEFTRLGKRVQAMTEDLTRHGAYVRTDQYLLRGDVVEVAVTLPAGSIAHVTARVAHVLPASAAKAIGRSPGMGFEFLGLADPEISAYLEQLSQQELPGILPSKEVVNVLLVEADAPMHERLSRHLGPAGFAIEAAASAGEAYAACLRERPHVLLADVERQDADVFNLIRMVNGHPRLAELPIMLMSDEADEMTRLAAYRLGVRDFMQKPFTDEEVAIRLRRLAAPRRGSERIALRGSLEEVSVGVLLSLLEFERKSGILVVLRGADAARLFVANGQVVRVESSLPGDARANLFSILDWSQGSFEFIAAEVVGHDEVGMATQHVLLEHARLRDESSKNPSS